MCSRTVVEASDSLTTWEAPRAADVSLDRAREVGRKMLKTEDVYFTCYLVVPDVCDY